MARLVLSSVSTTERPANCATPSHAPSASPTLHANRQAHALTLKERATMDTKVGSSEVRSCSAVLALSVKVVIGAGS